MTEVAIVPRLRPLVEAFTADDLRAAWEVAYLVERSGAERRVAHLYELYFERPALGYYRKNHRPPPYPPDAPPLPPRPRR